MKSILLASIILLGLTFQSCNFGPSITGSDNIISKVYDFEDFNEIDISQSFHIEIIQSETYKVEVFYNDNLETYLDVEKKGSELSLGLKNSFNFRNIHLKAIVHTPNIDEISMSGATKTEFKNFKTNHLSIDMSGASEIAGNLNVRDKLSVEGSGASNIHVEGNVRIGEFSFSGASKFISEALIINELLILDCSGASKTKLTSNGNIELDLSGASNFSYYGTGNITSQHTSGASSIKHLD